MDLNETYFGQIGRRVEENVSWLYVEVGDPQTVQVSQPLQYLETDGPFRWSGNPRGLRTDDPFSLG